MNILKIFYDDIRLKECQRSVDNDGHLAVGIASEKRRVSKVAGIGRQKRRRVRYTEVFKCQLHLPPKR